MPTVNDPLGPGWVLEAIGRVGERVAAGEVEAGKEMSDAVVLARRMQRQ